MFRLFFKQLNIDFNRKQNHQICEWSDLEFKCVIIHIYYDTLHTFLIAFISLFTFLMHCYYTAHNCKTINQTFFAVRCSGTLTKA